MSMISKAHVLFGHRGKIKNRCAIPVHLHPPDHRKCDPQGYIRGRKQETSVVDEAPSGPTSAGTTGGLKLNSVGLLQLPCFSFEGPVFDISR